MTEHSTEERIAALEHNNTLLRRELEELRASLSAEVRTRRLVVVADDGFERIVAESRPHSGGIKVRCRIPEGRDEHFGTSTTVYAVDDEEHYPNAGIYVTGYGDLYASLSVQECPDGLDERGAPTARAELNLHRENGRAGLVVDSDGVRQAAMRLYLERENEKELATIHH